MREKNNHRKALPALSELAQLHSALGTDDPDPDPNSLNPISWAQRKQIAEILFLIMNDIDVRDRYFRSVRHSPGQPKVREKKFFAELDYRIRIAADESNRGLREKVRKYWRLTAEQMRRAGLEHKADCTAVIQKIGIDPLRIIVTAHHERLVQ